MQASETPLKDVLMMLIDDQNAKGGLLGRQLEAVVMDPASNWGKFADDARALLDGSAARDQRDAANGQVTPKSTIEEEDKAAVVFGCWTSVSRKSVLQVFDDLNGLLFYPVQYEGEECQMNIFYTGAAPNQQAIPGVDFLKNNLNVNRWVLVATDYVYPRTTNEILEPYLKNTLGFSEDDILIFYTPFGHTDWEMIVKEVKAFSEAGKASGKKTGVVSTINGDSNTHFYTELINQGIQASDIPVVAFSIGEPELKSLPTDKLAGHYCAWNYFQSIDNPVNKAFVDSVMAYDKWSVPLADRTTSDPVEAHYIGWNMWVQSVLQGGTVEVESVRQAMYQQSIQSPSGYNVTMGSNHHLHKPVMIGEVLPNGQFKVVSQTPNTVEAEVWSTHIHDTLYTADWSYPAVCGKCVASEYAAVTHKRGSNPF
eukprot:GFYU01012204.1.p1 GENE.GFYU01012204.1~~GFYU01012204.1.p1  ORF type:complete len:480 (+),score=79.37 GFYU01012204.1:168-1442(+)